jgi:hypothetical protein
VFDSQDSRYDGVEPQAKNARYYIDEKYYSRHIDAQQKNYNEADKGVCIELAVKTVGGILHL